MKKNKGDGWTDGRDLFGETGIEEGGEGGLLGGLDDEGAAGGQGGGGLEEEHGGGVVPGDDQPRHPDGLLQRVALQLPRHLQRLPVDLVRRARVVPQQVRRARDVDQLPRPEQLPRVHAVQRRQLLHVFLDQLRVLHQDPSSLLHAHKTYA